LKTLAGLAVFCGLAAAATAPEPELHIPFEKYKLANGMRVVLTRDTSLPISAVYLIFDAGARSDDKDHAGYAHLMSRLMFEGSANVKKGEYARSIQANGGTFNGGDHPDYADFSSVMPSNKLALALWLEADRMRNPEITEEKLKAAKEAIANERAALRNQPYREAMLDKWPQTVFADIRDSRPMLSGPGSIEGVTVAEAAKSFRTDYAPNNAVLVISGDFTVSDAKKLVDQNFGTIPAQPQPKRSDIVEPERTQGLHGEFADAHARFPAVIAGWPAPRRHTMDWYALQLLDALLTLGKGSKIEVELMRGRQSILQADENLGFPLATALDYRDPGYFAILLVHKATFTGAEIVRQYEDILESIANSGVDSVEGLRMRSAIRYDRALEAQTALGRARLLGIHEMIDGDAGFTDRDYAALMSITPQQLRGAISKYLTQSRADVLTIRPTAGASR